MEIFAELLQFKRHAKSNFHTAAFKMPTLNRGFMSEKMLY